VKQLRIAPIVEGHGEVEAIRILPERVWRELLGGDYAEILQPVRRPRSKLLRWNPDRSASAADENEIARAVKLAVAKLQAQSSRNMPALILLLLDADRDCPKELSPELTSILRREAGCCSSAVVLAKIEYETWFVAAAQSLANHLELRDELPTDPEQQQHGKGWIEQRFKGTKYSETVDQPRLTAAMDLAVCRQHSPSFDKLCRELEASLRIES
jgi:hypothetical protein